MDTLNGTDIRKMTLQDFSQSNSFQTALPSCVDVYGVPCDHVIILVSVMDNLGGIGNFTVNVSIVSLSNQSSSMSLLMNQVG